MRYLVMIRGTTTGYSADVPDLPGCVAVDRTVERTRKLIASAIELHLEGMSYKGEMIPKPTHRIEFSIDDTSDDEFCTWVDVKMPDLVAPRTAKIRKQKPVRSSKKAS